MGYSIDPTHVPCRMRRCEQTDIYTNRRTNANCRTDADCCTDTGRRGDSDSSPAYRARDTDRRVHTDRRADADGNPARHTDERTVSSSNRRASNRDRCTVNRDRCASDGDSRYGRTGCHESERWLGCPACRR